MRAVVLAVLAGVTCAGAAWGDETDACMVAAPLAHTDASIPYAAAAMGKDHRLTVVVVGTTSSLAPGTAAAGERAYPARLEVWLTGHLPGVAVKVVNEAKPRQSAVDMVADFPRILMAHKPDLVVWQTGTFDAIHGVDPEEYRSALEKGVALLHSERSDVIFMNMQYSPRTESMIAGAVYADNMHWVAMQQGVPLLDRFAIMRNWSDLGTFDLYATTKDVATAERVHDCLGRLLAEVVIEAAKLAEPAPKETR